MGRPLPLFLAVGLISAAVVLTTINLRWAQNYAPAPIFYRSRVAIIGGAGNIGSQLAKNLSLMGFNVSVFDRNPQIDNFAAQKKHSEDLTAKDLKMFGAVIFLGGCTGRKSCAELSHSDRYHENVKCVLDIVEKMGPKQLFIAASTSAISEGRHDATEEDVIYTDKLDEYSSSMHVREIKLRSLYHDNGDGKVLDLPKVALLRFGTVVGNSPAQRTDLMIPTFFKSAYTQGVLEVMSPQDMRSFLTLDDLVRAFKVLLEVGQSQHYKIWNLSSFSASVLKVAATISSITGATLHIPDEAIPQLKTLKNKTRGFTLNTQSFQAHFNFSFVGNLMSALEAFDNNVPDSITPKGPHVHCPDAFNTIACPVCGSKNHQVVLDLGSQPLANDFNSDPSTSYASERFPLKLVRCKTCNHYHLTNTADRDGLFNKYLYQSGTSSTLSDYFEWLAWKVINSSNVEKGAVLDIACNDGSQLDHFKAHGWKTFGVDPAANLVALARANGHTVKTGFWPLKFPELPKRESLTAITAQNVLAHVPDVVAFLKGCARVMGPKTQLYVQTSQCNMHQLAQFDTVYHEHISFFTGHSFLYASILSGLQITAFETTPIHGESCLITMELDRSNRKIKIQDLSDKDRLLLLSTDSLKARLLMEEADGLTSNFFAEQFSARALSVKEWIWTELKLFKSAGWHVGAYGAAAKGMVLLHYILDGQGDGNSLIDFVLDDAVLKQGTFCPGTKIPVLPTNSIKSLKTRPIALLVFAWNFFDEISQKVREELHGRHQQVTFVIPFPSTKVICMDINTGALTVLRQIPYSPTKVPNPLQKSARKKAVMVTHQRNEELLMPYFIIQHAPMFDYVFLIDFESTDKSLEIIDRFAPPSWQVVPSMQGKVFDAEITDQQVEAIEKKFPSDWVIALTTTEFLVQPDLRNMLLNLEKKHEGPTIAQIPIITMVGNDSSELTCYKPLPQQRHQYAIGANPDELWRYLHKETSEIYKYLPGRHRYEGRGAQMMNHDAFIMKWAWTPWPEVRDRKMKVGETIPSSDVLSKRGFQHTSRLNNLTAVKEERQMILHKFQLADLCSTANINHHNRQHLTLQRTFHGVFGHCP